MEETFLVMVKQPRFKYPKEHLLANISLGTKYKITGRYFRGCFIVDDKGNNILISGSIKKKFFKED